MLIDIEENEKQQTIIKLLSKLNEAEEAIKTGYEWQILNDLKRSLGFKMRAKIRANLKISC